MSRVLSDLTPGAVIYIDMFNSSYIYTQGVYKYWLEHTPFIYLGTDEGGHSRVISVYGVKYGKMNDTAVASYAGSTVDQWLENDVDGYLSFFDPAVRNTFVATDIKYCDYNQSVDGSGELLTISRKCFMPGYTEITGYNVWDQNTHVSVGADGASYASAFTAYTSATGKSGKKTAYTKQLYDYGNYAPYCYRSAYASNAYYVCIEGYANEGAAQANSAWYGTNTQTLVYRPMISIDPSTPVSDSGASSIFLLPETIRDPHWYISANAISLGKTATRPAKCKMILPHDTFSTLDTKVCNNFGDSSPTWVNCSDGETVDLGTTKTAADWELGFKLDATADMEDQTVGEPALIVVLDEEAST